MFGIVQHRRQGKRTECRRRGPFDETSALRMRKLCRRAPSILESRRLDQARHAAALAERCGS